MVRAENTWGKAWPESKATLLLTYPFETIAFDIAGRLQNTRTNNLLLLSIVDVFSSLILLVQL